MNHLPIKNLYIQKRSVPAPYYASMDLFTPNKDLTGWRRWLQTKIFRLLAKWGCRADQPETVEYFRTPIDEDSPIHERLGKSVEAAAMLHGRANTILIGPNVWQELVQRDFELGVGWVSLNAEMKAGYGRSQTVLGLDVHIVPEIEGFVVLPGRISNDGRYTPEEMVHLGVTRAAPGLTDYMRERAV